MARNRSRSAEGFEENMKKAFTEMLVLLLLSERDHYIGELSDAIAERSGHTILIRRPYAVILRLAEADPPYVDEVKRREGPEARIRQYYSITEAGREYLAELREAYHRYTAAIDLMLKEVERGDKITWISR